MATTTGSAERLQKAPSGWRLEFQQLVYNTPTLLRPKRFSVLGEQAILQQLRELSGAEPLLRDTERMFRGTLPDGAYVLRDGRWFPELAPEKLPEPEKPAETPMEATPKGRNMLDELGKRMQSLEDSVRELQEQLQKAVTTITAAAASGARMAHSVSHAEQAATIAAQSLPALAQAQPSAAKSAEPEPDEPPLDPDIPRPVPIPIPSAPTRKSITLPAMSALTDLIRGLAGPEAGLATSDRLDWSAQMTQQPVFVAVIQDHAGDEAGSMIFNLEAALRLAGALLMESEEVIESLLEEKVMSDEMLDAASEVCNTLTSALNKVSGNPHLRSGKMQPLTEARVSQLSAVNKRDDYRYNQGGRLSMVAC